LLLPSEFRELVSGRRRGVKAALVRTGLRLAEIPYSLAVRWRNHRFDSGGYEIHRVAVPVVSVGNLTVGGTGKTPMVEWIARRFCERGVRVAVVSRGYGAKAGSANDEAMELGHRLPDVSHVQSPNRVEAARKAVDELGCQVVVLDDGFQHRRLGRDLDIVLLDALEPFGFGHVFPRGTLREPVSGLRRAHVVVLSRAAMLASSEREAIRRQVATLAPHVAWVETTHVPQALRSASGREVPIQLFNGKTVAAFCGVGNPAGFRDTLRLCGYRVIALREYADHYRYPRADVESLIAWADGLDVEAVLCTHKDLVKLQADRLGRRPLWAVTIAVEFLSGQADLEAALARLTLGP
jgi:tetraacyldisaccharide 4'-kinase